MSKRSDFDHRVWRSALCSFAILALLLPFAGGASAKRLPANLGDIPRLNGVTLAETKWTMQDLTKGRVKNPDELLAKTEARAKWIEPTVLYAIAGATFDYDRDRALMWYAVAMMRARYWTERCRGRSEERARLLVYMSWTARRDIAGYIVRNRATWARAGQIALKRADLFADEALARMPCEPSRRIMKPGDLIPQDQWPALKARLRTRFDRYFKEQTRPQKDQIPATKDRFPVTRLPFRSDVVNYAWLDSETLAYNRKGPKPPRSAGLDAQRRHIVHIVRGRREHTLPAEQSGLGWGPCAGDGRLFVVVTSERVAKERSDERRKIVFLSGPLASLRRSTRVVDSFYWWSHQIQGKGVATVRKAKGIRLKQSGFDCRLVNR